MSGTPPAHDAVVEMEETAERHNTSASQYAEDEYKPKFYHRLARIMSKEKNLAIFRRFDEINMMQLMALQAEIVELQFRFEAKCRKDDDNDLTYSKCFHDLRIAGLSKVNYELKPQTSAEGDYGQGSSASVHSQYSLLQDLRAKLDQYNHLLLQHTQLSKLESPETSQLENLQGWLRDPKGGQNFLQGAEAFTWDVKETAAYVTLASAYQEADIFTKFTTKVLGLIFHRLIGQKTRTGTVVDEESGLVSYSDSGMSRASSIVSLMVSSVVPVLTIFALNSVKTTNVRIGLTMLFTAAFAGLLAIFSNAKRVEIFSATAAFAAIEVVFIGSALSSSAAGPGL